MPVYFTNYPPSLRYQPVRLRNGRDVEEYVEVYHVDSRSGQVVPSTEMIPTGTRAGPKIRKLGTFAYLSLIPPSQKCPFWAIQFVIEAAQYFVLILFYAYVLLFVWALTVRLHEWGT